MGWLLENSPVWPWLLGFNFSVVMAIDTLYPIVLFRWVGWGKRASAFRLNVKDWQGRLSYRLYDSTALWQGFPPERPDDPEREIERRKSLLQVALRSGSMEGDASNINVDT